MPVRTVELPYPLRHQREILADPHRFKVACLGRQAGKTLMGGIAALDGHGPRDPITGLHKFAGALHGASVWWISRDFPTASKIWRDVKGYLARWGASLEKHEQAKRIDFPGGGSLTIKSANDPDSLRGETLGGFVGDEVAFWNEDALHLALRPAIAVKRGWFLLISTPYGLNFFRDEWEKGMDGYAHRDQAYRSWHMPSHVNPALAPEELEAMRRTLGAQAYQREVLAEFTVMEGGLFRREWFRFYDEKGEDLVPDVGSSVKRRSLTVFLTADFAWSTKTYADFTVVCTWGRSLDGRLFLLDLWRGRLEAPALAPLLRRIVDGLGQKRVPVWVEASGPLVRVNAEARELGINVCEIAIHRESKDKVARNEPAAAAVEQGRVLLRRNASWTAGLIAECCAFPDAGSHDDQVDCVGHAVYCSPPVFERRPKDVPPKDDDEGQGRIAWTIGR